MDTNITARIADFRAPPPYPKLAAFEEKPAQGMTPEHLDRLDKLASIFIRERKKRHSGTLQWLEIRDLSEHEQIYIALVTNTQKLMGILDLTIPEAIDRLGWVDASAMVARWRNRRA